MMPWQELKALESLLNPSVSNSSNEDSRDFAEERVYSSLTPGHIGPQQNQSQEKVSQEEEIEEQPVIDLDKEADLHRGCNQPEYQFVYKQAVSCNDVYMQMSEKDISSMSCEDLVLKVSLPGTEGLDDLELDVQTTYVRLLSPIYFLALYLPHKVNMERSSANWNAASSTLTITMPIVGRDICNQLK
ncbi:unnamed protein product [Sphagnum jensenii]|uniref:PIH1D1/2/3 CS-like domain-containing protein n=1 Tax=Sphagnum jensenii TaxID=128206 RepID=A0ABP1A4F5_9BRYO